jgi:hypothetical protein
MFDMRCQRAHRKDFSWFQGKLVVWNTLNVFRVFAIYDQIQVVMTTDCHLFTPV